ncbi:MAG TPA: hypothetical protein VFG50_03695 [Rhodothermales bacterium]|nr:hypothetical protein [Rhodothermales bacterium]
MPLTDVKPMRNMAGARAGVGTRREAADRPGKRIFRLDRHEGATAAPPVATRTSGMAGRLPTWGELSSAAGSGRVARARANAFVESISTRQFVMIVLVLATALTLYIGHVQATQDIASELQRLKRENLRLHLRYNRLKGEFDGATGPAVIYERAASLGLEEGYAFGPTIVIPGAEEEEGLRD